MIFYSIAYDSNNQILAVQTDSSDNDQVERAVESDLDEGMRADEAFTIERGLARVDDVPANAESIFESTRIKVVMDPDGNVWMFAARLG